MAILLVAMVPLAAASFPRVPPLPSSGFPSIPAGESFARELFRSATPAQTEAEIVRRPEIIPPLLRHLGAALMTSDAALRDAVIRYQLAVIAANAKRIERSFDDATIQRLVSLSVVDPQRFMNEGAFRTRAMPILTRALNPSIHAALRSACLRDLNEGVALDFDTVEEIAVAWGSAKRRSRERHITPGGALKMPDDLSPIETSVYSINSHFFEPAEARTFIAAVRKAAPSRRILVLTDAPMRPAFEGLNVDVAETFGRFYTPWPRDPFTVARDGTNGLVFVNRPNIQKDREDDANMVRAVVQNAPFDARWTTSATPFHNGHILLTPEAAWISIHTVEIRALQLLGVDRVPTHTFATKEGLSRYVQAVRQASRELGALYGRPVRLVHPLVADAGLMRSLSGGGGHDLDSLVTILPQRQGPPAALVGDLGLGIRYTKNASWIAAQSAPRTRALQLFLNTIADHLTRNGIRVHRLPLLYIPAQQPYLLTWNNVVLEAGRAEGFASPIAAADADVRKTFRNAGYELTLFPPLRRSVELNGGYRCASNHIRR